MDEPTIKEQWLQEKAKEIRDRLLKPGALYEINGILYRCHKQTRKGWELRRFTGTLVVEKAKATATQLEAREVAGQQEIKIHHVA